MIRSNVRNYWVPLGGNRHLVIRIKQKSTAEADGVAIATNLANVKIKKKRKKRYYGS